MRDHCLFCPYQRACRVLEIVFLIACLLAGFLLVRYLLQSKETNIIDDRVVMRLRYSSRAAQVSATGVLIAVKPPAPLNKSVSRSEPTVKIIYCEITAYSPTVAECDASPLATASGKRVYVGGIAADLSILPFGSRVIIPGYNGGKPCTVIDTGGAIHGNKLDVFFWNPQDSVNWGRRRKVPVTVLYIPK